MSTGETLRLVIKWFRLLWRGDRLWIAWLMVGSAISAAMTAAFPYLWQFLVDALRAEADPVHIRELGLWILGIGVGQSLFYMLVQGARTILNLRIQVRARSLVFRHLTRQPDDFYQRWHTGDLVTRLTNDAGEKTAWFLCSGIFRSWEALLIVAACLGAMLSINPRLTAWVVLPLPLLLASQALLQRLLALRYRGVQDAISAVNDQITTSFEGLRIVRAAGLESTALAAFTRRAEALERAEVRRADVEQGVFLMYGYGWQVAVVLLLLVGGDAVIDGAISLGSFVSFEGFVMTLVWPMFDFGNFVSRLVQSGVALSRLEELMAEPGEDPPEGGLPPADGGLRLEGAALAAPGGEVLVGPITVAIAPGGTCQ